MKRYILIIAAQLLNLLHHRFHIWWRKTEREHKKNGIGRRQRKDRCGITFRARTTSLTEVVKLRTQYQEIEAMEAYSSYTGSVETSRTGMQEAPAGERARGS
jgi:hypothetical protein